MQYDYLVTIISQMTKSEKLFFRRNKSTDSPSLTTALYDTISKNRIQDSISFDKKLKKQFGNQLPVLKHQLLQEILSSSVLYHLQFNEQTEILHEICIIKTLRQKNQIELALKRWKKVFEKCVALEQPAYIEILLQEQLKLKLNNAQHFNMLDHKHIIEFAESHSRNFAIIQQIRIIYQQLIYLRKRSYIISKENEKLLNHQKQALAQLRKPNQQSFNEYFILYYTSYGIVSFLQGNFTKAQQFLDKIFSTLDLSNIFLRNNYEFVLDFIRLYFDALFFSQQYRLIQKQLKLIETLQFRHTQVQIQFDIILFLTKNRLYHTICEYDKVKTLFQQHHQNFSEWIHQSAQEIKTLLCASLSVSYFIAEKFSDSMQFVQQVMGIFNKSHRQEIISFFYLFDVMIAYELKNNIIFDSKYHNAYTHFQKYKQYHDIGISILQTLNKCYHAKSFDERKKYFTTFINHVNINQNKSTQIIFTYFDIPVWMESKVYRLSYSTFRKKIFDAKKNSHEKNH